MQENSTQLIGGINRYDPRSDLRAWVGYVRRPSTYRSSSNLVEQVLQPKPTIPITFAQKPKVFTQPNFEKKRPIHQKPILNYAGSFEMLPSKPKSVIKPVFSTDIIDPNPQYTCNAPIASDKLSKNPVHKFKFHIPKLDYGAFRNPSKFTTQKLMVGMAVALFFGGVVVSFLSLRTNQEVKAQVKSVVANNANQDGDGGTTNSLPDESIKPPLVSSYKVPATNPRVIRISKTGTEARILALNIAPNGQLKAPANIYDTGWYDESSKPGEAGAMVLDGHVSGPTMPGVFKKLGTLVGGDSIEIERGDGQKFIYTVTATELVDADKLDMTKVMLSSVVGKPGLNIITCGGKFNSATNKFEKRTVVYAVIN